jgi:hypothetical protein
MDDPSNTSQEDQSQSLMQSSTTGHTRRHEAGQGVNLEDGIGSDVGGRIAKLEARGYPRREATSIRIMLFVIDIDRYHRIHGGSAGQTVACERHQIPVSSAELLDL